LGRSCEAAVWIAQGGERRVYRRRARSARYGACAEALDRERYVLHGMREANPELQLDIKRVIAEGDMVATPRR
jgi:predicted ester cyclase